MTALTRWLQENKEEQEKSDRPDKTDSTKCSRHRDQDRHPRRWQGRANGACLTVEKVGRLLPVGLVCCKESFVYIMSYKKNIISIQTAVL